MCELITCTAAAFPAVQKSCRSAEGHGVNHLWSRDDNIHHIGSQLNHNNNNPNEPGEKVAPAVIVNLTVLGREVELSLPKV